MELGWFLLGERNGNQRSAAMGKGRIKVIEIKKEKDRIHENHEDVKFTDDGFYDKLFPCVATT